MRPSYPAPLRLSAAVADASDLAIARYDALTVDEITTRLPGLSQIDLAASRRSPGEYEGSHKDRAGVVAAAKRD